MGGQAGGPVTHSDLENWNPTLFYCSPFCFDGGPWHRCLWIH
jgi:hypothetical protein